MNNNTNASRESYRQMKDRHQAEINALPIAFAFSRDQYARQLDSWGITEAEAEAGAIVSIGGGFIRASDRDLVTSAFNRIAEEKAAAIAADHDGTGFIYQMFFDELNNHEYIYTRDIDETLDALNITNNDLAENKALLSGLNLAVKKICTSTGDI
jgi:hypothetical protein